MGRGALTPARAVHHRIAARLELQDAAARARGWTVENRPYAGRSYRDPRFDQLTITRPATPADDAQEVSA
ncbi:MAG: hypothetical protein DLM59_11330 [Pseudonocardiales bacterium]|nr:MAG: hypothetical protein DLM59_11330 [Pseudonocardiales bacterium]